MTLDIYKTYFYRKAPEKHLILAAKGFILLIAMLAYLLLLFGNLSTIFQTAFLAFSGIIQLAVPAVGGLFWKKRDARSALSGLLFGLAVTFLFSLWQPFVLPVGPGLIGLICNACLYFGMSMYRSRKQRGV